MPAKWDIFALSERMMAMDDAAWARHANPLSVYSRMSILPLMTLAVFSRVWLGWGALLPIGLVILWTWWNPRAFAAPSNTKSWAAPWHLWRASVSQPQGGAYSDPSCAVGHSTWPGVGRWHGALGLGALADCSWYDAVWAEPDDWRQTLVC